MKKFVFIVLFTIFFTRHLQSQPLSGFYTIGPSQNYTTINDAINALINNGVSGPVTFIIYNGNYYEDIYLPEINGASAQNTITFRPKPEDSTLVHIIGSSNSTITLDRADYIRFRWLTIENANNHAVFILNGANHNIIANCQIIGNITTSTDISHALVYSQSTCDSYNTIEYTRFEGGSYGIYWLGDSNQKESHTIINGNLFYSQGKRSIYLENQIACEIRENTIFSNHGYYSIWIQNVDSSYKIINNKTWGGGIVAEYCYASPSNYSIVANNFVRTDYGSGIINHWCSYVKVVYNTVKVVGGPSYTAPYYCGYDNSAIFVRNNIFINENYGAAFLVRSPFNSDFNVLYTDNANYVEDHYYSGGNSFSFNQWQQLTNNELNSLNIEPVFTSFNDYHTLQQELDGSGTPIPEIDYDIDHENRDPSHPDIGADEFTITNLDFSQTKKGISIYPNPINDNYIGLLVNKNLNNATVTLITMEGKPLETLLKGNISSGYHKIKIKNKLHNGIYFLRIKSDDLKNSKPQKVIYVK